MSTYTKENIHTVLQGANMSVGILRAAGYNAKIVGGANRVQVVGGYTSDVDIGVLCTKEEVSLLKKDLHILFSAIGIKWILKHESAYEGSSGFLADWRVGDLNLIAYDSALYPNFDTLVLGFDFNFNMYLQDKEGLFYNPSGHTKVWLNPNIADHHNKSRVVEERYLRFRAMLAHLDWSEVTIIE